MNALPSPLPYFPNVTIATIRSRTLASAMESLSDNLTWLADSAKTLQRAPLYDGEHLEHVGRVTTYTQQATYWANLVSKLLAEGVR